MKAHVSDLRWVLVKARGLQLLAIFCVLLVLPLISSGTKASPDPSGKDLFVSRSVTQQRGPVSVRAVVLTDHESEQYFGVALADEGIQALWLSVENVSDDALHYLPVTTDSNYFTASEVARLFHSWWPTKTNTDLSALFARETMPDVIPPRQTGSGFVLTHREGGLKFLNVGFIGAGEQYNFRFVLPLDRVTYAVQKVDFGSIYPRDSIEEVDLAGLRSRLEALPCCTVDAAGTSSGDPLNIVVIGGDTDGIFPFIVRGWRLDEPLDLHSALRSVRAFLFGTEYLNAPVSPLYVFGRTQDLSLQKARDKISLRNHLRVWLAPFTIDGQHVWVGQISRDIGIKLTTQSWYLTTHRVSPNMDEERYYLLQDLIMTGEVTRFGFVRGVGVSTEPNRRTNLTGDPYSTDGLRLVVFLGGKPRPLNEIDILDWERPQ
jgi:hypothetical protein